MPEWLTKLLADIEPLSSKADGAIKAGEAVASELASSDSTIDKVIHVGQTFIDYAEEVAAALEANTAEADQKAG